jgi:aspartyl-tRNA(Asn)/glutamyl-tRNA(Gln) amidotransferase subunit C
MRIDKDVIRHVAELARLHLSEKEIDEFLPQLKEVLEAFSKLDEVDAKDAKPSFQPIELRNAMREDAATECLSQEEALKNSPSTKDGYFKGPRAI